MFQLVINCVRRKYDAIKFLFASLIALYATITHLVFMLRMELRNAQP